MPLEQHFIGVKGKPRSFTQQRNMDQAVFDKVVENVREGHQVMVFVHARKETVKTAQRLREMATEEGVLDLFDTREHPKFQFYRRDVATSRNKEMKELFDSGFGIHHAGMLRSDRNMMERMFEDQSIKVLCCTSTLAWGVNLPAHAVVIKGTNVYDSGRGAFVDLSVLDVLQVGIGLVPQLTLDLRSCRSPGVRDQWCRLHLHQPGQAGPLPSADDVSGES